MTARILKVCTSTIKGIQKTQVESALVVLGFGVEGDAHGGDWHRQVSLLANESAEQMRNMGAKVGPGDFGENILTEGIELHTLSVGTRLDIGDVELEVTQIGKECHTRCAIFDAAGTCIMPTHGIFCRVLKGGTIRAGLPIKTTSGDSN
ncbi:MAG: MOSC domain-containing protein [Deltaproteobacteria bacterium]|nr:MOSC domain-containing protein [Deltaproteobacteria bacterium]